MPRVNHEILAWARETAGYSIEEAAKKAGFLTSKRSSASDKLVAIETGEKEPTRSQLVRMAEKYRRPLLTFYLAHPPAKSELGADFRTIHGGETSARDDALLDALLRDIRARQSMIRSTLEDEDEAEVLPFVGSHNTTDGHKAVLTSLRKLLGVELHEYRKKRNSSEGFNLLRTRAEQAGVFVVIRSNLGNYTNNLDTSVFRGFTIADPVAPFIVINGRDAKAAWPFTLLHELTHILLGQTGVGNSNTEEVNEQFCDNVAGAYLLHPSEIAEGVLFNGLDFPSSVKRINSFANERNISRAMVVYNAFRADLINRGQYHKFTQYFRERWKEQRENERIMNRETASGPDHYVVRRYHIGNSMRVFAKRMMDSGALSTSKAAKILGVKPKQVQKMLERTL